jgi:hypothetical protein
LGARHRGRVVHLGGINDQTSTEYRREMRVYIC